MKYKIIYTIIIINKEKNQVRVREMEIKQQLINKLVNKQAISQKQLYSLEILKMSEQELFEFLKKEKEENPLLEIENEESFFSSFWKSEKNDKAFEVKDETVASKNLIENIKLQINNQNFSHIENEVLIYILNSIDESGFLDLGIKEIRKKFDIDNKKFKYILELIKEAEPNGIGTKNTKDFFKYQLLKKRIKDKKLIILIDNYLEKLTNQKELCKELDISEGKLSEYIGIIKGLKLKPIENINEKIEYIFPDIIVKKINNEWKVMLNEGFYKNIKINREYSNLLEKSEDQEMINYINKKIKRIDFIIKCIEQRRQTLYKIGNVILEKQKKYFEKNEDIIPMKQKDIALELNVHESTISRAIKNKYLESLRGIVKIKSFFSIGYDKKNISISSLTIKKYISEIISNEKNGVIYSDEKIRKFINEKYEINISRRTVAKYRKELKIYNKNARKISR